MEENNTPFICTDNDYTIFRIAYRPYYYKERWYIDKINDSEHISCITVNEPEHIFILDMIVEPSQEILEEMYNHYFNNWLNNQSNKD
jgi:hypothetical protein